MKDATTTALSAAASAREVVSNPFAVGRSEQQIAMARTTASTDAQRAIAEVQAAMVIAKTNRRDPVEATDRILNACTRPSLAESALYQYSKGGTEISGPSIRLAETLAQNWGNIQFGIRELERTTTDSVMQAYAWDIETNVRKEITFSVPLIRYTKKGSYKLEDPREIYEQNANQASRRLRSCILSVIPGDVTETAVKQCELTLNASADVSPDAIKKMLAAFETFGVTKQMIEQRIQRHIDSIRPAQMVSMKKIYASLKDGMSSPGEWFEFDAATKNDVADTKYAAEATSATKTETIKSKIASIKTSKSKEPTTPPQPQPTQPLPPQQNAPVSFHPEYKELMSIKNDFPEAYQMAKRNTGLQPDSIENCLALIHATKEAIDIMNETDQI